MGNCAGHIQEPPTLAKRLGAADCGYALARSGLITRTAFAGLSIPPLSGESGDSSTFAKATADKNGANVAQSRASGAV